MTRACGCAGSPRFRRRRCSPVRAPCIIRNLRTETKAACARRVWAISPHSPTAV